MSTPRPFLNVPYGAYLSREVPAPDEELTRVGPGTPCGEYLRRFWQPVAFARELGAVPLAIRIMGEELVVFRDLRQRVGLLQRHCTHRGTSLEFGLISERGIRCCYHGWVFDVDGRILETPGEPPSSTLRDRLCQGAYPTHELAGLVFAYMGPPDRRPAFPLYDTFELPGFTLEPAGKFMLPCNWLQIKDNSMDPSTPRSCTPSRAATSSPRPSGRSPSSTGRTRPPG
jgi:phenylpropionate dioxygenase-like ring-hydroxylating dioxygenase large terminal subunit